MKYFFLIAGQDDDLSLLPVPGRAVSVRSPSPVKRQNDLDLVELPAGRAGDSQPSRGFGKLDLDRLSTNLIAAIHPLAVSGHLTLHPFRAKP